MKQIERGIFKGFLHRCNHNWSLVDSNILTNLLMIQKGQQHSAVGL